MKLEGKKVLLTGASGFIPSHLCRRLVEEGATVYATTKYNSIIDNVRLVKLWDRVIPVEADLRNPDSLLQIREIRPHVIFHLAAYNHVGDSFLHKLEALNSNSIGTVNLMDAYEDYECFVYTATSEVYGYQESVPFREDQTPFPLSPYALGKYAGELYARLQWKSLKRPVVVLRPFNAYGPYQSPRAIIAEMILKALRGEDLVATEGRQTRDFNFVENLADGFALAVRNAERSVGEIINIGSGEEISIRDLVLKIYELSGSKSRLRIGDLPYRPGEIWRMCADNRKARELLGWSPRVDLHEGLQITIEWYRRFLKEFSDPQSALAGLAV